MEDAVSLDNIAEKAAKSMPSVAIGQAKACRADEAQKNRLKIRSLDEDGWGSSHPSQR